MAELVSAVIACHRSATATVPRLIKKQISTVQRPISFLCRTHIAIADRTPERACGDMPVLLLTALARAHGFVTHGLTDVYGYDTVSIGRWVVDGPVA